MKICGCNLNRAEAVNAGLGIVCAFGLVATTALGFCLKFGNLRTALNFRVSIATAAVGLVTLIAFIALFVKKRSILPTNPPTQ